MPPEMKEAYSIGAWNGACMDCHVTRVSRILSRGNKWDTTVAEFGIACEACHSEGANTIDANRNRFALETSPDDRHGSHDRAMPSE
jgi:hypothetical protein